MLREVFPDGRPLPDDAIASLMLDRMQALANEIGPQAFHAAVLKAIDTCTHRPSIGVLRRLAGVSPRLDTHADAVVKAWDHVLKIARRHLGRDGEGNVVLRPFAERTPNGYVERPVPQLTAGVLAGLRVIGGWEALAETSPEFLSAKWAQFRDATRLSVEEVALYA